MLEFVVSNWIIFVIVAVVLLLGLFGYIMDRKKYNDYRDEILSGNGAYVPSNTQDETEDNESAVEQDK